MEKEIKIADFLDVIKKRLWVIVVVTILTTAASGAYGIYQQKSWTPLYPASTSLLLNLKSSDLNTLGVIVKDSVVLNPVIEELQLKKSADALARQVSFRSENDSQIVKITVVDPSQEQAARIANNITNVFIQQIGAILGIYDAKILSEAKVEKNATPVNEKPGYKLEIGFAVGMVLSIGIVLFLDSLDHTIQSAREAERLLGLPILGSVSKMNSRTMAQRNKRKPNPSAKGEKPNAYQSKKSFHHS